MWALRENKLPFITFINVEDMNMKMGNPPIINAFQKGGRTRQRLPMMSLILNAQRSKTTVPGRTAHPEMSTTVLTKNYKRSGNLGVSLI